VIPVLELASRYVVPSLLRMLAEELVEGRGLSRVEAARRLGVTPSAVTRYLKGERGALVDLSSRGDVRRAVRSLAERLASGSMSEYELQAELARIALYAMGRGYLCSFHSKLEPAVNPLECRVCSKLFSGFELPGGS